MKTINVKIRGIVPLLQHRYVFKDELDEKATKKTGCKDYSDEWKKSLYYDEKIGIYQPASHIESAMIKAAVNFQIPGKGKKTYKDLFKSAVFVSPECIPHNKKEPDFIDKRLVRVNGSGVERLRPAFKDWILEFNIQVYDEQLDNDVVLQVLTHAGRFIGIGDFRPRYGRFSIEKFD
jgi:hypothetical protein